MRPKWGSLFAAYARLWRYMVRTSVRCEGCTHSIIRLQFGSGNVYSVRHMCISDMMLWANVDRSVHALICRALCFHFVSGAVVVLLLQYYAACMISRVLWYI